MQMLRKYWGPIVAVALMLLEAALILLLSPHGCSRTPEVRQAQKQPVEPAIETKEVSIGETQRVTNHVDPGHPMRIEFEVVAIVQLASADEFEKIVKMRNKKLVELVREVVTAARIEEIRDPQLTKIKKRLYEVIRETIGKDKQYFESIVIPTFNPYDL